MAATGVDPNLQRFLRIYNNAKNGKFPSKEDLKFYYSFAPEIDEEKIAAYEAAQREANNDPSKPVVDKTIVQNAVIEMQKMIAADPNIREKTLEIAKEATANELGLKIQTGINLVLGGTDIANSVNQIRQSDKISRESKRPSRPTVPQRDILLQQALRQSQENTFNADRAIAPVRAEIQDQYLNDVQAAKTASTGQAGSYGAYRQLAANRRNRSAMELAPIVDQVRAREQQRTDDLLGARMDETQQMFRNQAYLYPYDLDLYKTQQESAAQVGAAGRLNLRDALYRTGANVSGFVADNYMTNRYRQMTNEAMAAGMDPKYAIDADMNIRKQLGINYRPEYGLQERIEQSYLG